VSEIRSQATPVVDKARGELGVVIHNHVCVSNLEDCVGECYVAAAALQTAGWSKPRTVKSADELDALPEDTVIRVQKRKGAKFATYYEKIHRNMWLALDPGDRSDGEDAWDAPVIVRFNEAITVLFTPGDAG